MTSEENAKEDWEKVLENINKYLYDKEIFFNHLKGERQRMKEERYIFWGHELSDIELFNKHIEHLERGLGLK